MTIAKRMAILLASMLIGIVAIGGVAVYQIFSIRDSVHMINGNVIPSLVLLDRVSVNFGSLRSTILRHILATDDQDMKAMEAQMTSVGDALESDIDLYLSTLATNEKDRDLLVAAHEALKKFYVVRDDILQVSRRNEIAAATQKVIASAALTQAVGNALQAHIDYNIELAEGFSAAADSTVTTSLGLVSAVALISLVTGMTFGFLTYRRVLGALNGMRSVVGGIAANRDFTGRVEVLGKDEVADTGRALNSLLEQVQGSFREIRGHSDRVSEAASRLASAAQQVASGSDDQSEASASMAAAIEQLTVSINHVSDRSGEASKLVQHAGTIARNGGEVIGQTLTDIRNIESAVKSAAEIVGRLNEGSAKVTAVVAVIKEVADQTNLLALNAAIEAARAGEQGRGFAVVADEVRKLAERTAVSTQEISSTMLAMHSDASNAVKGMMSAVEQVDKGVEHTREAEVAVREIGSSADETIGMVGEISQAIREQSSASSIIAQKVERIAQMSEENSAAAGTTSSTAADLNGLANAMRAEVQKYRV